MTDAAASPPYRRFVGLAVRGLIVLAIVFAIILAAFGGNAGKVLGSIATGYGAPHLPNLALVAAAPLEIKLHLFAVLVALGLGAIQLIGVKGTTAHRIMGWTWVLLMLTAAISSLFIRVVNNGQFSFIHLFAVWTLIAAPLGVFLARRHKIIQHGRMMSGLFYGGLILAGVIAFLPGRLMWQIFFG